MAETSHSTPTCPMTRRQVIDRYFLEHRAKLLDLAAFLDRLDRAQPDQTSANEDARIATLQRAMEVLTDGQGDRARRIQQICSDPSPEPAESAEALGPAQGAPLTGPND